MDLTIKISLWFLVLLLTKTTLTLSYFALTAPNNNFGYMIGAFIFGWITFKIVKKLIQ